MPTTTMTTGEFQLAERAADTLVDLIRSLESRDPQHPEIAVLNKIYQDILFSSVRCIAKVEVQNG